MRKLIQTTRRLWAFAALAFVVSTAQAHEGPRPLKRPDILALSPPADAPAKIQRGLGPGTLLEAVALYAEMYPKHELYFLARDAERVFDVARIFSRNDPQLSARLHLLNVSSYSVHSPDLKDYLEQEGISERRLRAGTRILLIDSGFHGTIPSIIASHFPAVLQKNIQFHLISSYNPAVPSTQVVMTKMKQVDVGGLEGAIHFNPTCGGYAKFRGVWQPVAAGHDQPDFDREQALEDMKAMLVKSENPQFWERFERRRQTWKMLRELYMSQSPEHPERKEELKAKLRELREKGPVGEAIAADFKQIVTLNRPTDAIPAAKQLERLSQLIDRLPKLSEEDREAKAYYSPQAKDIKVWLDTSPPAEDQEQAAKKLAGFVALCTQAQKDQKIRGRDYRRLLALAFSAGEGNETLLGLLKAYSSEEPAFQQEIDQRAEFFLTAYESSKRDGMERTKEFFIQLIEAIKNGLHASGTAVDADCADVFAAMPNRPSA